MILFAFLQYFNYEILGNKPERWKNKHFRRSQGTLDNKSRETIAKDTKEDKKHWVLTISFIQSLSKQVVTSKVWKRGMKSFVLICRLRQKELQELLHSHESLQSISTCPSSHHQCAIGDSSHPTQTQSIALQLGGEEIVALLSMNANILHVELLFLPSSVDLSHLPLLFYQWQARGVKSWRVLKSTTFHTY